MGRLAGKRILVTGAGGNLGSAVARAYLEEGARVVLTSRGQGRIDDVAAQAPGTAVAIAADLNDAAQIDHLASAAWDAFGGIDGVLLSSQPSNPRLGDLLTTSDEDWQTWFQTIVWGPLRLMRHLAPRMMDNGGGSVIAVTSSTGDAPEPGFDAYGLGKAGLWWLTRYMAREWGPRGIRANALQPGLVATAGNFEELEVAVRKAGLLERTSLGRLGSNKDCLGAAIFLASDESAFVSGQRICVDGGRF
ncbi:MAG TPA: SDR family oxidoreductase [Novosphingobium sp.]|nr:SDR family oxidoreductase [Novosphingobium sp.]